MGFWPNPRSPALRWRMCSPPAASVSSTRTHHILALSYAVVSHGTPKTEPRALGFWDFGPSPAPGFALANVQPPRCLCVINSHPPPPSITLHRCFTRHARNQATKARFSRVFGPNHINWPRIGEHPAPPPPPFYLLATTTSQDCTTPQFYRNRATEARFLGFWPNPCPLTSR